jgi:hypothetical protein
MDIQWVIFVQSFKFNEDRTIDIGKINSTSTFSNYLYSAIVNCLKQYPIGYIQV